MQVFVNNLGAPLLYDLWHGSDMIYIAQAQIARLHAAMDAVENLYGDSHALLTLDDGTNIEIVRVVWSDNTQVWTSDQQIKVLRAQEGTTARDWAAANTRVEMRITAGYLNTLHHQIAAHIATDGAHVLVGANGEVLTH